MQCPRCHAQNDEGARFCEDCGARLEGVCPSCGQPVTPGKKFCRSCGAAVTTEPPRFASPQVYTPKHLAEKILTSKSALEGERKQVTVLFADLKGSMELLADRDPEEARKLLDPVLDRMMEAVHRYEGTVNQVMGDGVMALFGAPLAHEDHAVRACYAAMRMQESVRRHAEAIQRREGLPIHVRIGLNSGEVVVRSIGSDLRMDYTAVGQTTHLAARMEQMAMPGSILITADTLRLAEGYVRVGPLGPIPVKGLSEPVEVYEVIGAEPTRTRFQAAAARGLTRFVGRDPELGQLRLAIEHAGAGHGQVVALVGEPGVGKSRLVWEFTHSHRTHGWVILESGSVSYGKATSYLPVVDFLKAYFKIQDRDDHREIREKVTGKILTLDEALKPTLPAFLALLDVPVGDPRWEALDPPQRRQQTLDAVKRLLLRESRVQPLLLVFEDLHWIDAETQALLDSLVESLPTARILLLVNYRPEYGHHWGSRTYYTQLRLDPLPPESAQELLAALLGDNPALQPLKTLLVARTEGNPFFLEESVRTLVETRVLLGDRGAYRLARAIETIRVPATVQAVLAARIDRLAVEDKGLLQSASVIGKDVPFTLLQAVADVPDDALRQGLARLQAGEFLYETTLFPDPEYTFKHALTHEVAYESLLTDRRRALHARIVGAIEQVYADRLAEYVERLAHHALRGELEDKSVAYLRQAGVKATTRAAYRDAVARFEEALGVLGRLPETPDRLKQAMELRFDLRTALLPSAEFERILGHLAEAETLAGKLGDRRALGWVFAYRDIYFWVVGDNDRALEAGQRACALAADAGDFPLRVVASAYLGAVHFSLGDFPRVVELLRSSVAALQGDLLHERFRQAALPSVYSRVYLAWALAERGEFPESARLAEEALGIAQSVEQPFTLILASFGMGVVHLWKGEPERAIPVLERGLELIRTWQIPAWFTIVAALLGCARTLSGRLADGLTLLDEAVDRAAATGNFQRALWIVWLAEARLLGGQPDEAQEAAERALVHARQHKERAHEAEALRLLGEIAAHRDPPDVERAEGHYRAALALAETLGMRPLAARCHLGLGKLYRRTGDGVKAQEHLATATKMYREMDMDFWLAQAEAALGPLGSDASRPEASP